MNLFRTLMAFIQLIDTTKLSFFYCSSTALHHMYVCHTCASPLGFSHGGINTFFDTNNSYSCRTSGQRSNMSQTLQIPWCQNCVPGVTCLSQRTQFVLQIVFVSVTHLYGCNDYVLYVSFTKSLCFRQMGLVNQPQNMP